MVIDKRTLQTLKIVPNSGYDNVKVEFLFHSNKIEGSTFTRENLEKYLNERIIEGSHDVDDVLETIHSTELFDFVVDTLDEPLSEKLILEFHRMLTRNTKQESYGFSGVWKKIPNQLLGVGSELVLAQPFEVPQKIRALLIDWENGQKDFGAIITFHTLFEKIHPFQDGNGRIGRFIMFKQCIENAVDLISLDAMYMDSYKKALFMAQTKGEYDELKLVLRECQELFNKKMAFLYDVIPAIKEWMAKQ